MCTYLLVQYVYPRRTVRGRATARSRRYLVLVISSLKSVGEQNYVDHLREAASSVYERRVQLLRKHGQARLRSRESESIDSEVSLVCSPVAQVQPGAEIILPPEVEEIEVSWSKDNRLGKAGDRCGLANSY